MSKSSRQIAHIKEYPIAVNSTASMAVHRRYRSIQNRNFGAFLDRCRELYMNNQMVSAIECIQRGLYYDSDNLQLNFMLGMAHLSLSAYTQALSFLEKVAKINNHYKNNLFLLIGIAHNKKGDVKSALQAINQQITLNEDEQALFYRARIFLNQGKHQNVLQDINKLLIRNPHHAPALLLKVRTLSISGNYSEALQIIRFSKTKIEQIDKQQQIRLQEVSILTQTSRFQEALQCLNQLQRQYVILGSEVQLARGLILQKTHREQQAVILYNQILQRSTQSRIFCEAVAEVSIYYMKQRDFYQAFSYLKRTNLLKVRSKPTDNLLRLAEGLTFLMKKKYAQAILLLGACKLQFRHSLAQHTPFLNNLCLNGLAFGNFSLGNHQAAYQLYKKINTSDSKTDMTAVIYNMSICQGVLIYLKGYKQQAIQVFYKAYSYVHRPQPFFYIAVIKNEDSLSVGIDTDGFAKTLELIEKGLRAGESAHMYYYRSIIYLFLGMNSEALEDIDRAIQKSEDNVARYFHARGILFMLDKNYQQASSEFATALSIDENDQDSAAQRGKCQLLSGDVSAAYTSIKGLSNEQQWRTYFKLYQKDYDYILKSDCQEESTLQICNFMAGKFEKAGPAGKLVIAILYENYAQVVKLIEQAASLGVSIGCLDINDLLILQAYSEYRLNRYEESSLTLTRVQRALRQTNSHSQTYCEQDERKLLLCKVNQILINIKRGHRIETLQLAEELLAEVCQGPISDELHRLRAFLLQGGQYQLGFGGETFMISDYFLDQDYEGMRFKFLVPMPHPRISQVEDPQYQRILTSFSVKDIQSKPQAPWIKRGEYGVIFTNQIKQYKNLNLKTEQNQAIKSKMPDGSRQKIQETRSRFKKALQLSKSVVEKLDKLTRKQKNDQD